MKRILPLIVLSIVFVRCGDSVSSDSQKPPQYPLQIDFQSGFQGDSVVVKIDGIGISAKRHTSSETTGYADSAVVQFTEGRHVVFINSPELKSKIDTTYTQPKATAYMGVGYDRISQRWYYRYSTVPFVY